MKFPGFTQIAALSGSSTTHCHSLHPYNNTSVIMTGGTKKTLLIVAILNISATFNISFVSDGYRLQYTVKGAAH